MNDIRKYKFPVKLMYMASFAFAQVAWDSDEYEVIKNRGSWHALPIWVTRVKRYGIDSLRSYLPDHYAMLVMDYDGNLEETVNLDVSCIRTPQAIQY